ncbi:MAG: CoA pyrophosphatase [Actinomycetota bacterium]|nr:CoA pyrophosphatase [Actinomycetota bacterium]
MNSSNADRRFTIEQVVEACRSLPEPGFNRIMREHPRPRPAATLVPVVELGGQAAVVLTRRTQGMDHGGDWVFPGGRLDDQDTTHAEAARRETAEELGIDPERIEVVGQLTTHGPIITGYVIEVFVGVVRGSEALVPDAREVSEIAVIPLADLVQPDRSFRGPMNPSHRHPSETASTLDLSNLRHYSIDAEHHLWGLQADILHELLAHLTDGAHDL